VGNIDGVKMDADSRFWLGCSAVVITIAGFLLLAYAMTAVWNDWLVLQFNLEEMPYWVACVLLLLGRFVFNGKTQ
jgi:hypothetical protein